MSALKQLLGFMVDSEPLCKPKSAISISTDCIALRAGAGEHVFPQFDMLNRHRSIGDAVEKLSLLADYLGQRQDGEAHFRIKREDSNGDMGVT